MDRSDDTNIQELCANMDLKFMFRNSTCIDWDCRQSPHVEYKVLDGNEDDRERGESSIVAFGHEFSLIREGV